MTPDFPDDDVRLLTPEAFDFVLGNELKRAVRSQNCLTLVLLEPSIRGRSGDENGERDRAAREIARLIGPEVRETDLISHTGTGRLSVVLLDADADNSVSVIDRLMTRLERYEFAEPLVIGVGAASCPTHGSDLQSLCSAAKARQVHSRRASGGEGSSQSE